MRGHRILLAGDVALEVEAHIDALAILHGLSAPYALIVLPQIAHIGIAVRFDPDLACPSVKLFAPEPERPDLAGCSAY